MVNIMMKKKCGINSTSLKEIFFTNEYDLTEFLNNKSEEEIIIKFNNTKVEISNSITICELKSITFIGTSKEDSILNFKELSHNLIFEFVDSIKFHNISINGNISFKLIRNIIIEDVNLNGTIKTFETINPKIYDEIIKKYGKMDKDYYRNNWSLNVYINNFEYHAVTKEMDNCIELYGNTEINNSRFYGSPSCRNSLLKYYAEDLNSINISNSHFDGAYSNNCISINNAYYSKFISCTFEKGRSDNIGGGGFQVILSDIYIEDCIFKDNYTTSNGGSLYLYDIFSFETHNCKVYNTTAIEKGSFIYMMTSVNFESLAFIYDTKLYGVGHLNKPINNGGLIAYVEGTSILSIENFYGEDLDGGNGNSAFIMDQGGSIFLNNITLRNIRGNNIGGVLLNSYNENFYSIFYVGNGTFIDFYQNYNSKSSTFIYAKKEIEIILNDCYIYNIGGKSSYFIYSEDHSNIEIYNFIIDKIYTATPSILIKNNKFFYNSEESKLSLTNFILKNYEFYQSIISYNNGIIIINNSTFSNIQDQNGFLDNKLKFEDIRKPDSIDESIIDIGPNVTMNIVNSVFKDISGNVGFSVEKNSNISIMNSEIKNLNLRNSFIEIDSHIKKGFGYFTINNTSFLYNTGKRGTILNINEIDSSINVSFYNSTFKENVSLSYGGVIYSKSNSTNLYVSFNECKFINNSAYLGGISFSYSKISEAYFSNIDELRKTDEYAFSTNPTKLILTSDSVNYISIKSGDIISSPIKFNIMDDYNKVFNIYSNEVDYMSVDFMMYFKIETNDTYNAAVVGQSISYCYNNTCDVPIIKVVGNPGNYKLQLKLITFHYYRGDFVEFPGNVGEIDITIEDCNNTYIVQDIENIGLKSCYIPHCNPSCNTGKCINNNICDCTQTYFTGLHCNEYHKLERKKIINLIIKIMSYLLIILTIILIFGVIYFRNHYIIKAASYDFLIVILIGIIFYCFYSILLTYDKTSKKICILSYLFDNMGFSFIYGSILVKTYRIYLIFNFVKENPRGMNKKSMLIVFFIIILIHITLMLIWDITDSVESILKYTYNFKEYSECLFPESSKIGVMLNLLVILFASILSYINRTVLEEFKEDMSIPIYVYILYMLIAGIINVQDISIYERDIFCAFGTAVNAIVTMKYLYMDKFNKILTRKTRNVQHRSNVFQI